jgi:hypothetical protein
MKDIKLKTYAIIPFDNINFSSLGRGMKIKKAAIITEVERNNIRLTIVTHCQTANTATINDIVNIFSVFYFSVVTTHSFLRLIANAYPAII